MQNKLDLTQLYQDALVWDAHAGVFPSPEVDLNLLEDWRDKGANYLSINVGFDVMDWQETMATLAAYRRWVVANPDRFTLTGTGSASGTIDGMRFSCRGSTRGTFTRVR